MYTSLRYIVDIDFGFEESFFEWPYDTTLQHTHPRTQGVLKNV